jgi:hypothetical protein
MLNTYGSIFYFYFYAHNMQSRSIYETTCSINYSIPLRVDGSILIFLAIYFSLFGNHNYSLINNLTFLLLVK